MSARCLHAVIIFFALTTKEYTLARLSGFGDRLSVPVHESFDTSTRNPVWTGRWFPQNPAETTVSSENHDTNILFDSLHGVKMGIFSDECDNAKVNLTLDWDFSPIDHTCFLPRKYYPDPKLNPIVECDYIPKSYTPLHECMNKPIHYDKTIPTFGTHRPLWPQYGEYRYVPPQRWVHNLEHGAIVMLYHPCADGNEVKLLRKIVTNCLYRHIITPYAKLTPERPYALVGWGCSLSMSKIDLELVISFIKHRALQGPEKISRNGQYDLELVQAARVISDIDDSTLCPTF